MVGMTTKITKHKKTEIKAPQAVVHIKHTITLRQYKIWLVVLQKYRDFFVSKEHLDEEGYFSFPKKDLDEIIGYEFKKEVLKQELNNIRRESIIISFLEKGGEKATEGMGFISRWKVTSKTISIELPPFLKKVMEGLENEKAMFQLLNWQIFNHFSGKHEAVIYKLCRDYIGAKNTPYMEMEKFREYMGIKKDEYPEFKTLNHYVIKKAVANINKSEISDITIKVQYRIENKKVIGLYFIVERRKQMPIPFPGFEEKQSIEHIEKMIDLGISPIKAKQLEKKYGIECLTRNIDYTLEMQKKGIITQSLSGYLIKAITDDIGQGHELQKQAKARKIEEKKKEEIEEMKKEKNRVAEEKKKENELKEIEIEFNLLSEGIKNEIRDEFEKQADKFTRNKWKLAKENSISPENESVSLHAMFYIFYKSYKEKIN